MRKNIYIKKTVAKKKLLITLLICLSLATFSATSYAATWQVTDNNSLKYTLNRVKAGDVIELGNNITFTDSDLFASLDNITIDGKGLYRLEIAGDLHSINNATFANGKSAGFGGAIYIRQDFTGSINNSTFMHNIANNAGAIMVIQNFSGSINNSIFTHNTTTNYGGAIFINQDFKGSINNSAFMNNTAAGRGGAIFIGRLAEITVDHGASSTFYNNTDGGVNNNPNSTYFWKENVTDTATFTTHGSLYLYDPIAGRNTGKIPLAKDGAGLLLLGGNNTNIEKWNINDGTLRLTYDSAGNKAQITGSNDFNLTNGATLEIVPNAGGHAVINATTQTALHGNTTVGSDYRYHAQLNTGNAQKLLEITNGYTGTGNLTNPSGKFILGQYEYTYDGLAWSNNKELNFNIKSTHLSPEVTGVYSANASLRTSLANKTSQLIFARLQTPFQKLKAQKIPKANLTTNEKEEEKLWATTFYNQTNNKKDGTNDKSKAKVPGLILGTENQITKNSFFGGAVSIAWPDYNQGKVDANGKDIRLNLYGGSLLKNDIELGYIISAGFGDMSQERNVGGKNLGAKYDTRNYTLGLSLAKEYIKSDKVTIRPFLNYEYITAKADGYTENDDLVGITANGQKNNLHRIKLGNEWTIKSKENTLFKTSLYYQGLYGDTKGNVTSYITSSPGNTVSLSGSTMNKHALGIGLMWGKQVSEKVGFDFTYDGTFGSKGMSNDFKVNVNFKF